MHCTIHSSTALELDRAIEEVFTAYHQNQSEGHSCDFVMIALSCRYPIEEVNVVIPHYTDESNYVAFHATDSFHDSRIVNDGVTALFISFEREGYIECFVGREISQDPEETLQRTADYLDRHADAAHLFIAGTCRNEMAFFVDRLNEREVPSDNILGGVSSGLSIENETYTYQFYQGEIIRDGFVIVTFHHVQMGSSVAMGFRPVGTQYTITKAKGYRIYEVDGGYPFSATVQKLIQHIDDFQPEYLWYTPVVILQDDRDQTLLTLRTFRNITSEWVEFYGPVKEGQRIKLTYGEAEDLLGAYRSGVKKLKKELPDPEILFNFSCTARQYVLEQDQAAENIIYLEEMQTPLFGFFTFGEIGHDPQKRSLQFYNETSLLIGMCEQ